MQAARPLIGYPLDDLPEEKQEPPRSETTPPPAPRGGAPAASAPTPPSGVLSSGSIFTHECHLIPNESMRLSAIIALVRLLL